VDDILAIVDEVEAEKIRVQMVAKFGTMLFEINGKLSYLGMKIEISDEGTKIEMSFYVKQIIEDAEEKLVLTEYESPGTKETFVANESAGVLSEKNRVYFHSTVAKLLYLAKRARPDILTVVMYLCTREQHATMEDERKLGRVLG